MKLKNLVSFACILILGCSSKPGTSIDSVKNKAASGDVQGVYLLFDKPKITDDLIKQYIKLLESENKSLAIDVNIQRIKNEAEDIIKLRVWDVIDDEVKKGADGSLAKLKIVKEDVGNNYNANVLVQFDNGKQTTMNLSLVNNKWLITGLNFNDVVKNKIFHKLNARPSFPLAKIKSIEGYVGKYQDDQFHSLIRPELKSLVGNDYDTVINNIGVSGPIRKEGQLIIVEGNAPHSGGYDNGIIVIDAANGVLSVAIKQNGTKINKYSDIKDPDDYPALIKSWM